MMRIGIFGGTFNPIHIGHLRAAEEVRQKANLNKVIFIPSGNPPLKTQGILPASMRFEMVRLALNGHDAFEISNIELNDTEERSFSVLTIQRLLETYNAHLFFMLGTDAFLEIPFWHEPDKLMSMIDFIIMTRPGIPLKKLYESRYIVDTDCYKESLQEDETFTLRLTTGKTAMLVDISHLDISSTKIRRLITSGKSIRYLVTESVYHFITLHNLYTG
ncbi:MAG: nicotinate-nucleotide adenylyltransferase [Thermodesulfovibrionales bacterium]